MVSGPQYFNAAKSYARAAASSSSYAPAYTPQTTTTMSNSTPSAKQASRINQLCFFFFV
jgi:hypothetical protein